VRLTLLIAVVLGSGSSVFAQSRTLLPEAQGHVDTGRAAYATQDYATAADEFARAYAIDDDPSLIYAEAQARRLNRQCSPALELYRKYLATHPNAAQITATNNAIAMCTPVEDAAPPVPPEVREPLTRAPERVVNQAAAPAGRRPVWYRDGLGDALTLTGLAGIGTGVGFYVAARSREQLAGSAEFRDDFGRLLDEADTRRRIAFVAGGVGSALLTCGIVRYVLHDSLRRNVVAGTNGRALFIAGSL
jgi:hypothetical protein